MYSNTFSIQDHHRCSLRQFVKRVARIATLAAMELLGLVFASSWASGLNAYATVLLLGLLGRFAGVSGIPAGFERTDVLIVAAVLTLIEFVADKIPYVDSIWDAISTFVRPVAGAVIGALIGGATSDLLSLSLAALGGVTALLSHAAKAGIRLAANTSPEPVTNLGLSLTGDVAVVGVVSLAVLHPVAAAIVAAVALLAMLTTAVLLATRIRAGWRRLRGWLHPAGQDQPRTVISTSTNRSEDSDPE